MRAAEDLSRDSRKKLSHDLKSCHMVGVKFVAVMAFNKKQIFWIT